ncbi:unnamed protein product [Caenorhabditis bovis]|uniref:IBB domain-containing protein n=1 Tax=Caenorhabditis bovis TaxID=2654633 RepID=A0A8S1E849_9PELO|nr:unnamed protein product [Caenorhabditis bovis]
MDEGKTNHEGRSRLYKSNGFHDDFRRKRRDDGIQIRKQKRMDIFENRRKISQNFADNDEQANPMIIEIMNMLKCGDKQRETASIKEMATKMGINEISLKDLCGSDVLSTLAEMFCNRPKDDPMRSIIVDFFQFCSRNANDGAPLDHLAIESLCMMLLSDKLKRCLMWTVTHLIHNLHEYSPHVEEVSPLIEIISSGMQAVNRSLQNDAARACALLIEWPEIWDEIHTSNLLPLLVGSLASTQRDNQFTILRAIDFITQTTPKFTRVLIDAGLLENFMHLINCRGLSRDICFILSNLAAEGEGIIDMMITTNLLRSVAAFTLSHCCQSAKRSHIAYILEIDALPPFTDMLTCMDAELVLYILDAIEALLQYGEHNLVPESTNPVSVQLEEIGCREKLEFLSQSQNMEIHIKAYAILERISIYDVNDKPISLCEALVKDAYSAFTGRRP